MGRSKSSCFKIIACARGDLASDDPVASLESKVLSDKPRWSFRKRSHGHQVPISTVISEPVCVSYHNEKSEVNANNSHSPKSSSVSEKTLIKDTPNEIPPVSFVLVKSELDTPLVPDRSSNVSAHNTQESVVVIIQAFIRGYLVRRELHKLKNVIKLQAAVRGHLVRRQAVGTLRCAQAIIKMQALIRARHARMFSKKLDEHVDEKFQMDFQSPDIWGKGNSYTETDKRYKATKSLLSNGFALKLLESAPTTKPIYINCDPSKSDSAWKWLERWMAVTLSEGQPTEQNVQGCQGQEENPKPLDYEAGNDDALSKLYVSSDSKLAPCESTVPTEDEMHFVAKNSGGFEFNDQISIPEKCCNYLVKDDQDQSLLENEAINMKQEKDAHVEKSVSPLSRIPLQTEMTSELVHDSISNEPESDCNLEHHNTKVSREASEDEEKEFIARPKGCNPVLSDGQLKFEDLMSTYTVGRTIDSSQDATADSRLDNSDFHQDSSTMNKDLILLENTFSHDSRVQVAASECGTEISISSTLDSPDRSEGEGREIEHGLESLKKYDVNDGSDVSFNPGNVEAKPTSFHMEVLPQARMEECDQNLSNSIVAFAAVQVKQQSAEPTTSGLQSQAKNLVNQQIGVSSPQGTPRSHTITPKLRGGSSSKNTRNAKKNEKQSKRSDGELISQIGKRSPSNLSRDSGGRCSMEQLQKESKNAKRRNSLGIAIPDHGDQEPRISTSNSLPSYMQATESARAKAHASISPKSIPDLHNKDNHTKKRHSLPIANGKQGSSPRMQISKSQAHESSKGNGTHSPRNSAERRWQR